MIRVVLLKTTTKANPYFPGVRGFSYLFHLKRILKLKREAAKTSRERLEEKDTKIEKNPRSNLRPKYQPINGGKRNIILRAPELQSRVAGFKSYY